jgi:mutator protein MutT
VDDDAVTASDPLREDLGASGPGPPKYALSAVVYAERDDEVLLLRRAAGSALAGQWFLPGGMVEAGELPEEGARRELREEAGIEIDGELELVGCYPLHVYGHDFLQLSFRGRVAGDGGVVISEEHEGEQWVRPGDLLAMLTDDVVEQIAGDDERVTALLGHIRRDLERYLRRVGGPRPAPDH